MELVNKCRSYHIYKEPVHNVIKLQAYFNIKAVKEIVHAKN